MALILIAVDARDARTVRDAFDLLAETRERRALGAEERHPDLAAEWRDAAERMRTYSSDLAAVLDRAAGVRTWR